MKPKPLPFPKLPHDLDKVPDGNLSVSMLDENFDALLANQRVLEENNALLASQKTKGRKP